MIEIFFKAQVQARFDLYLEKTTFEKQMKTKLESHLFFEYKTEILLQDSSNLKDMKNDERFFKLE